MYCKNEAESYGININRENTALLHNMKRIILLTQIVFLINF